ncbi:hypothetical protein [Methylobacterium sp. WL116]|uniref:hypothetical protein n=1 Tax=Methylobacterium sp. WL116 TaxID=2603889 RepID=UPI0011CCDE72|nr:hypothetical protein [Methylobacterium sp. WL116]TXM91964.1 hypothetical protein FV223_13405 [Methylobacterium sp. WL116]
MRSSSAALQNDNVAESYSPRGDTYNGVRTPSSNFEAHNTAVEALSLPTFDARNYAATSKIAARVHTANVSQGEIDKLERTRRALLDKKYAGEIRQEEINKLAYVRWSLDRIEDAKYGTSFDLLEEKVIAVERLIKEMAVLKSKLTGQQRGRRR